MPSTRPLRPVMMNNTRSPRFTATAGTKLVGTSYTSNFIILPVDRALRFTSKHSRNIAGSRLRALSNIPHCCRIRTSGPFFNPSVVGHPLRSTKDHRLGMLLITPTT
jgi:hypothetical protein